MVDVMTKSAGQSNTDDLVSLAHTDAEALGRLYDLYYERIFRFCVHRLFYKETAQDVTSAIFLQVARQIAGFKGQTQADFRNWLYAIAANHANSYIRKTLRQKQLLAKAADSLKKTAADCPDEPDWPMLYAAISRLKPKHQTIVTLRFFENMEFEEIGKIINAKGSSVRVMLHRILKKLRRHLQAVLDGEK
jgi:RNA polymerase sigma-70 factor (ECF subfamily)